MSYARFVCSIESIYTFFARHSQTNTLDFNLKDSFASSFIVTLSKPNAILWCRNSEVFQCWTVHTMRFPITNERMNERNIHMKDDKYEIVYYKSHHIEHDNGMKAKKKKELKLCWHSRGFINPVKIYFDRSIPACEKRFF